MARMDTVCWQLELGGEVIAAIDVDDFDFPFHHGHLVETAVFERFRPYFEELDTDDDDAALDALCMEVVARGRFPLRDTRSGSVYGDVYLHHDGDRVWFRHGGPCA